MRRLILWLKSRSKPWVIGTGVAFLAVIGLVDHFKGPQADIPILQADIPILYVMIVASVAWLADRKAGVSFALACAVLALLADLRPPITAFEFWVAFWKSAVGFGILLIVALLVSGRKVLENELERTIEQEQVQVRKQTDERRRAEEAAQVSQTRLGAYVDTALDGIVTINDQAIIDSFNPAAEGIFGYRANEAVGQNMRLLVPPPWCDEHDRYIRDYLRTGQRKIIGVGREVFGRRKDGSLFPMELAVGEVQLGSRRLFTGTVRDITRRRQLEKQVLEISDQERRRIAQDLHDGLCQHMAATEFATQVLTDKLAEQSLPQAAEAKQIVGFIQRAITQAHEIARGLHPVEIGPGGLMAALADLSAMVQNLFHIACVVKVNGVADLLDDKEATHIYRIVQEAVANAIKHGKPSRILIELSARGERIVLTVNDNGLGFPEQLRENKGMGISTMNYRACVIGATLAVRRDPNGGTAVVLSLPKDFHARMRNDS